MRAHFLRLGRNHHIVVVLGVSALLTAATAAVIGPAAAKLEAQFGMIGWMGRIPFYALLAYIGPTILWMTPSVLAGSIVGALLATPLSLWAAATHCPLGVVAGYFASGLIQGAVLSYLNSFGGAGTVRHDSAV